jgi:hypothetical protein
MKSCFYLIFLLFPFLLNAQTDFDKYFTDKSLRFDFLLGGDDSLVYVFPQQMAEEPHWAGPRNGLISPFNYGTYRFQLFDTKTNKLIFSKGFSTLFQEWQTTAEAKITTKAFYQAAIFPFPKHKVRLHIDARQWDGTFSTLFSTEIDPDDYFIKKEKRNSFQNISILSNGNPHVKVDLVILAEGYALNEREKFEADAKRVTEYLFSEEPFKSEKENFNINAVFVPSAESGTDVPGENIYKNTHFNSTFYTFDLPRYLTTSDMKSVYDAASATPYDQIYVLVNTDRYGGGGFYNFLSVCTSDNLLSKEVFIHEFGHGLAGLGDEYYTSDVAYEDFYNLEVEPWEANLTTLVNFEKKWKATLNESTPIPTPRNEKFKNTVGVYEGGGYMYKGIYSPFMNCRMKSNNAEGFCPVCQDAIKKVIRYYCEYEEKK